MKKTITLTCLFALVSWSSQAQQYLMTSSLLTVNSCTGVFYDSGGPSGKYTTNQNYTTVICPDISTGTHIRLSFTGTDIGLGDDLCFFNGNSTASPSLGCVSDFNNNSAFIIQATANNPTGCITVRFQSNWIFNGEGWSASIECIPACQTIFSIIASSDPLIEPADTGYIDVCPGDTVFFTGMGEYPQNGQVYQHSDQTSSFFWTFGDGSTSTGKNVSHVYDESGGYVVELTIRDQFGCKNTNLIKQRVRVAPRPTFNLGAWDDVVCAGDTVILDAMVNTMDGNHTVSVLPGEDAFQTGGIRSDSLPLPDGNGASYSTSITFTEFAPGQTLTDINDLIGIFVNMEHSWMRDLTISITCPSGNKVVLHNHPGQTGGEVFLGVPYVNDEGFPTPIPGVGYTYGWQSNPNYNYTWIGYANLFLPNTLPAGTYRSFEPLTNLLGCPLNGDWTITVTDLWSIDNGNIFSWSIEFDEDLFPALEAFSPDLVGWQWLNHPSIFHSTPDSLFGSPVNAGEVAYSFQVEDSFGCLWDTTVNIEVLPFTHPDCYDCGKLLSDFPDTAVCLGGAVDLDVSSLLNGGNVTFESYDDYEIGAANHPPATPYISTININSIQPLTITNPLSDIVSICLDLETDKLSDINVFLQTPTGQQFNLTTNNGGNGTHYTQTCFTPTATAPVTAGVSPFTGNYRPEGNWATLAGNPINGPWRLRISDAFGTDVTGLFRWWSITFKTSHTVTYTWQPTTGLSCTDCPNPTASPSVTTIYSVTASDNYGCIDSEEIEIAIQFDYFAPDVQLEAFPGGVVRATWNDINPGTAYEVNVNNTGWVPSNNGNLSHMINGLNFGNTINIQVRSVVAVVACAVAIGTSNLTYGFCTIDAVLSNPAPYQVSCNGICDGNVQISASNGVLPFTYMVVNNTTGAMFSQNNGNLVNLCPGNYTAIVSDADDCKDTLTFQVLNKAPIVVIASVENHVSCFGGNDGCASVVATGGAGGFFYTWNDPNLTIGDMVCGLSIGPVIVTATDIDQCQGSGVVTITQPPQLVLQTSKTDVNCLGGNDGTATANVTGGTMPYTYNWSGGATPNQATTGGLVAGNYNLTVTDANGCQVFGNVMIAQPATGLSLNLSTFRGCFGQNQNRVTANVAGGQMPYQYLWTPTNLTTPTIDNLPDGNYTVVVTDAAGCTLSATAQVTSLPAVTTVLAFTPPSCYDRADGSMAANIVTGGTGMGYTYLWSNGDTDDFTTGLLGGLTYCVTVFDSQGCRTEACQNLPNPPVMEAIETITDVSCNGLQNGSITIGNVANANGPVTYLWDAAAGGQTTPTVSGLGAGNYSLTVTDGQQCSASEIFTVDQPAPIELEFDVETIECFGASNGSVELTANGGQGPYTFFWSNGATSSKLSNIPSALYYVSVTDANQCIQEDSVLVAQPDVVSIVTSVQNVSCFGKKDGSVTVEATGGTLPYRYSLDNAMFFGSKTLIALLAGDYTVYVKDANDCVYQANFTVNQPPQLSVSIVANGTATDEIIIQSGEPVNLDADITNGFGNIEYIWSASWCGTLSCLTDSTDCNVDIACADPVALPDFTNDYFLLIQDENGCKAEDHIQVHVKKSRLVVVPTGFTPNADGTNDLLPVHGRSGTMIRLFQVFDRWGELMYQDADVPINDITRGWDGTFKSKEMPPGVYVWYIEAEYADGMTDSFKGETTLVR